MSKHTPGPWVKDGMHFFGSNGQRVITSDGPAFGSSADWSQADANKKLILAAPDLLDALQSIVASAEDGCAAINTRFLITAKSAIAKATGKPS